MSFFSVLSQESLSHYVDIQKVYILKKQPRLFLKYGNTPSKPEFLPEL